VARHEQLGRVRLDLDIRYFSVLRGNGRGDPEVSGFAFKAFLFVPGKKEVT
jgi:hypothetical protein